MKMEQLPASLIALIAFILAVCTHPSIAIAQPDSAGHQQLVMSRAELLDRTRAIWTAQMIGQWTGLQPPAGTHGIIK
jgi:hypothetical protein